MHCMSAMSCERMSRERFFSSIHTPLESVRFCGCKKKIFLERKFLLSNIQVQSYGEP